MYTCKKTPPSIPLLYSEIEHLNVMIGCRFNRIEIERLTETTDATTRFEYDELKFSRLISSFNSALLTQLKYLCLELCC